LRIGLMLDLGVGQALEQEVREVAVKAAKAFESAGAVVTEVDGMLTREMLDGLDNFWRARCGTISPNLRPPSAPRRCPISCKWAEAGAKLSGVDVIRGFNATMAIRAAAAKLFCDLDYVISPVSPVVNFAAEFASPINDPDKPFEHIATPCRGTCRKIRPSRSMAALRQAGFPIGVQIVGRRFDDLGVLGMAKAFEACAVRKSRGRARRRSNSFIDRHSGLDRPSTSMGGVSGPKPIMSWSMGFASLYPE
jgi:aspartyl-tRNA(Asn)/glutamyl-tRNA(Gln) amidotransferase subunit A